MRVTTQGQMHAWRQVRITILCLIWTGMAALPAFSWDLLEEDFESRFTGFLNNQGGWRGNPVQNVVVQTQDVFAGQRAARIADGSMSHDFDNNLATNVWIDFYGKFAPSATVPSVDPGAAAVFYINSEYYVVVASNKTWVRLNYQIQPNEWARFVLNVNYNTKKWQMFAADDSPNSIARRIAYGIGFQSTAISNTRFRKFKVNHPYRRTTTAGQ